MEKPKRIRLSDACYEALVEAKRPLITRYDILLVLGAIAYQGNYKGALVYSLKPRLSETDYRRVIKQLTEEYKITQEPDFPTGVLKINRLPDISAEEACCLVDPYCYISHLSAMQQYGLTNRIPDSLILTRPAEILWKELANQDCLIALSPISNALQNFKNVRLKRHAMPHIIRKRPIKIHTTKRLGRSVRVHDSFASIARIEQVFCDTLTEPNLCGGMTHVMEVWAVEAVKYLERIIVAVNALDIPIAKVRAGYILEEFMGIKHPMIEAWQKLAQRGSSRVLDPAQEFAPKWSEKWMLSLNTELPSQNND